MTSPELYLAPLVGKEVRGTSIQENSQTLP
jgi:hypothetical protein